MIRLIFGLGNPGPQYDNTRHNIGYYILDNFARVQGIKINYKKFGSLYGEKNSIYLIKPLTFMNNSGQAVADYINWIKIKDLQEILVIADDIDLPLGKIRVRTKGSSGGHKGIESIIKSLNSSFFPRMRIGVGKPEKGKIENYVLTKFSPQERDTLKTIVDEVIKLLDLFIQQGEVISQTININVNPPLDKGGLRGI